MQSIRRTTMPAGTSPGRPACSALPPRSAKLLGLPEQNMIWALGLAATQAAGLREMFGSMGKAFHPGRSAQSGYLAALLARDGFTSGEHGIEGPRGFAPVQSQRIRSDQGHRPHRQPLRSARKHLQAVPVRHRDPSDHRCLHSDLAQPTDQAAGHRGGAPARRTAGARSVQQEGHQRRPRRQVLGVPCGRDRPGTRQGGPARIHR